MNARAWFRLGRVSNLPTVWSNVLAAVALAGAGGAFVSPGALFGLLTALSLFYVAGMVLNDAFDAEIEDAAGAGDVARRDGARPQGLHHG